MEAQDGLLPSCASRRYKTIVIDPPWSGPGTCPTFKKKYPEVVIPYSTMTGVQISAMRIQEIAAENSLLFLWTPSRNIGDAFLLQQLWGYNYRGLFVWIKPLGMGHHMRHQVEFILYGAWKNAKSVKHRQCPIQLHYWKKSPRHSEKPEEAYDLIRSISEAPRIDIFARQRRPGFDAFGNEIEQL